MLADDGLDLWGSFYFLNVFVSLWVYMVLHNAC